MSQPPKFPSILNVNTDLYRICLSGCMLVRTMYVCLLVSHNICHRQTFPSGRNNNTAPEDLTSNLAKKNMDCTQGRK